MDSETRCAYYIIIRKSTSRVGSACAEGFDFNPRHKYRGAPAPPDLCPSSPTVTTGISRIGIRTKETRTRSKEGCLRLFRDSQAKTCSTNRLLYFSCSRVHSA
ncbi:hypothetical protein NXS19_007504 [Fusarium pseudograminearum]|nr:hypothetical protein NXS19_007504 [Fusarium pseudograminearum]